MSSQKRPGKKDENPPSLKGNGNPPPLPRPSYAGAFAFNDYERPALEAEIRALERKAALGKQPPSQELLREIAHKKNQYMEVFLKYLMPGFFN